MKAITLADIARAAGVHKATAGRALNRDPRISPATRARVDAAAEQLGYRVNHLLAAWMSTRRRRVPVASATIAYVTGHPTRFGWRPPESDLPDFFPGARSRAEAAGFKLETFWLREPGMNPSRFRRILEARGIQGVLIGRMPGAETTLLEYDWSGFSVAALGLSLKAPLFHRVRENHFNTTSLAAERCYERGYRRIGLVFDRTDDIGRMNDMWTGGFLSEQAKWPRQVYRVPPLLSHTPDRNRFCAWFRLHRPDVLLVSQIEPVRDWLAQLGASVPREVGLVNLRCYAPDGPTAGIYYNIDHTGSAGVELLIALMHRQERGVPERAQEILLPGDWIEQTTLRDRRTRRKTG